MNAVDWPHEKIRTVALRYIKKHTTNQSQWRFTSLDTLPERLVRIVPLDPQELPIVTCFIDAQRWYYPGVDGIPTGSQGQVANADAHGIPARSQ